MSVRAKFKVDSVTTNEHGGSIKLLPVTHGSEENEKFFKWTPYGQIEIGTVNEDALKQFKPGTEFYVDFSPASVPEVAA